VWGETQHTCIEQAVASTKKDLRWRGTESRPVQPREKQECNHGTGSSWCVNVYAKRRIQKKSQKTTISRALSGRPALPSRRAVGHATVIVYTEQCVFSISVDTLRVPAFE
jgi:hypothetical protein